MDKNFSEINPRCMILFFFKRCGGDMSFYKDPATCLQGMRAIQES